ncbi:response regulator aspartate phosphatase RapJ, partial [Xanthomonas citri pv. citri]|nr:response regulator aspartate phosphatase RapJ [Xanthomonas citri pv. citri]
AVFSLTHIYCKEGKYDKAVEAYDRGIKSAAEWEDDMYLTKFRLIHELYLGSGDLNVLTECFDLLESRQLLADAEDLLHDTAERFNQLEHYESAAFFYRRLMNIKKKLAEQRFQ